MQKYPLYKCLKSMIIKMMKKRQHKKKIKNIKILSLSYRVGFTENVVILIAEHFVLYIASLRKTCIKHIYGCLILFVLSTVFLAHNASLPQENFCS